jgi:hypothetical protein
MWVVSQSPPMLALSATRTDATALVCGRFWRMRTFGHIAAIDGSEPIPEVIGRGPSQVRKFQ